MAPIVDQQDLKEMRVYKQPYSPRHARTTSLASRLPLSGWFLLLPVIATLLSAQAKDWSIETVANPTGPGQWLLIKADQKPAAAWTYGAGQFKPYLHVFGSQGEQLTNSGLDSAGKPNGTFGHHRGIFIGWNRIQSELGRRDLWHMKGTQMTISRFTQLVTTGQHAVTEADIIWRAGLSDNLDEDLLISETRKITVSHPLANTTQIDFESKLTAARDLELGGDLQHAGIHFRAEDEVAKRRTETAYVWSPDVAAERRGMTIDNWQWATLIFPIGDRWYQSTEMTAPANEFSELSWRDYGRFGFFEKKSMKEGETLALQFRFQIKEITDFDLPGQMDDLRRDIRTRNQTAYAQFLTDLQD